MFRVATYNARHGADYDGGGSRSDALVSACAALDADVLAVQELDRRMFRTLLVDQPRVLARGLSMSYAFAQAKRLDFGHQCNALYVRGKLRDVDVVQLPRERGMEPRNAIIGRAELTSGDAATVACTHLQHRPREHATVQLHALLDALLRRPGPHVLLGDLNLDAAAVTPQLRAAGLTPVEAGFTSPRDAPREQIDWVAASEDLAVVDAGVGRASVSDHLPLFASLSVREPGEFR